MTLKPEFILLLFFLISISFFSCLNESENPGNADWPNYLGSKSSNHYSPANEITTENVTSLKVAWTYHAGDSDSLNRSQIQCNPLIIDGVLFGSSPMLKFFALNAQTGEELWKFDPFAGGYNLFGMGVNRGIAYWSDGGEKRLFITAGSFLMALNAHTGQLIEEFGNSGRIDLHEGLGKDMSDRFVGANAPGIVFENLLILGTRVDEGTGAAPGHIRAYNIKTGEMEWIFHTIPKPGEFGHETWPPGAWDLSGGANNWSGMSIDPDRGMVFIPTGSATYDFYGADRHGENLFANCLIALNARTGERIWHYQFVHHDLWDRDLPAPPNLVTLDIDGKKVDAVAQITKSAHIFMFNRETGKPIFPIEESSYPASDLPNEQAWPTQPLPTKPPPFGRQELNLEDLTNISPESNAYVKAIFQGLRSGGQFIPPSREGTVIFPGYDGGGEWGGAAVNPEKGILYINASEMPWVLTMVPVSENANETMLSLGQAKYTQYCGGCHGLDRQGGDFMGNVPALTDVSTRLNATDIENIIDNGQGAMPPFKFLESKEAEAIVAFIMQGKEDNDYSTSLAEEDSDSAIWVSTGYNRFLDQNDYPAVKPPWGTLTAIDLNQGTKLWQVTLGEIKELSEQGFSPTGAENYGGPLLTQSGLIFIGATKDEMFRAFDTTDGKLLWEFALPAGGYATPSSYMINGKQYVVIACGGGKMGTKSGDTYMAFSLP